MSIARLLSGLLFLHATSLPAAEPVPGPGLPPDQVVAIQLEALQANDERDAGIERTWAFAHPLNKFTTGPLERFAAMIRSPGYRPLLGHEFHTIKRVVVTDELAVFAVAVRPAHGPIAFYQWRLQKVRTGRLAGAWMTIAVSPAAGRDDSI